MVQYAYDIMDRVYSYDDLDRLASDGDVAYTYDAADNRMTRTEDGETITYTLEGTTRHIYDDNWQVIADIDENGSVVASYVWGEGIDKLLAVTIGGATYYPLTDVQGTVWGYVDAQNNIVARWQYDAWGKVLSEYVAPSAAALAALRYRFQCREWSATTGLINFRMRWYDAETGRWLSKDPIGISGGLNLYVFCLNNPMNGIDPFGRCTDDDRMDWIHTVLDIIGTFDPTPVADGINAIIYATEGNWNDVAISAVAMVPYFGDAAKAGKYGVKVAKDFKRLSKGEVKAVKKEIGDVHDIKINSKQDLFKNSNGDIYSFPKNGK